MGDLSNTIIPPLLFFIVFFAIFGLLELMIVYALNILMKKHWEFVVDNLIRARVRYGKQIHLAAIASIVLLFGALYLFTSFFEVVKTASNTVKVLGLFLVLVMIVIYIITSKKMTKTAVERDVHYYIFFVTSIIIYVFLMIAADRGYETYQAYISRNIVEPTVEVVTGDPEAKFRERTLEEFRGNIRVGDCPEVDYALREEAGITHFVYLETDAEFAQANPEINPEAVGLKGRECVKETRFILTDEGKWYEVIFEALPTQ